MPQKIGGKFEKSYKELNPEQKSAVDEIEGPVMVIAGPGTGKTQILTLRIANILKKTDTDPENILALTFTNSGVHSMRKRLVDIVGSSGYRVTIATFHGFCNETIKTFPEYFPRIIGSRHVGPVEQIKIIEKIISDSKLRHIKSYNTPFYYLDNIIREIDRLKRENINPSDLAILIKEEKKTFNKILEEGTVPKKEQIDLEKFLNRNEELLLVYKKYETELKENKFYDYGDMVMEVIRTMESDSNLLIRLQEEYQYILADEHQDANQSQNKLLELLSNFHDNPNLFIVGDEKQAIFQFQGASLDNFDYFKKLYPKALVIPLVSNYRSNQAILDSAHSLITKSKLLDEENTVNLEARTKHPERKVNVLEFSNSGNEYHFVANKIQELMSGGVSPEDIAILYRNNKDADKISEYLERDAIPHTIHSETNILNNNDVRKITTLVRAIKNFGDEYLLGRVLMIDFLGIDPKDAFLISKIASSDKKLNLLSVISDKRLLKKRGISSKEVLGLYEKLTKIKRVAENKSLPEFFEFLLEELGIVREILSSEDSYERMEVIRTFFDEIKQMSFEHRATLDDLSAYLDILERYNVSIAEKVNYLSNGVWLMTAHRSKGMEFDYVFIIDVVDGRWGNKRDRKIFKLPERVGISGGRDSLEDDRRLFYVALTRARKEVFVSYPILGEEGRQKLESLFIGEIDKELVSNVDTKKIEKRLSMEPYFEFKPRDKKSLNILDKDYLRALFLESGLSATSLNNFLECPWRYFFNNLIRLPQAQNKTLLFGQATHNVLRDFFNRYKEGEDMKKEDLLRVFDFYLKKEPMSLIDYEDALLKGEKALSGYYDTYNGAWPRHILNEFSITGVTLYRDVPLRGRLDKIEFLDSGRVSVVDYKTGKPKSRNDILGQTKTSRGNLGRQLVFYKILLSYYNGGRHQVESGVIDFVEPNDRGKYKKEIFEIGEVEKEELMETIRGVIDNILDLAFLGERCDQYKKSKNPCEYCMMADDLLSVSQSKSVINTREHKESGSDKKSSKTK